MYLQLGWLCSTHPGAREGQIYLEGFHPGVSRQVMVVIIFSSKVVSTTFRASVKAGVFR